MSTFSQALSNPVVVGILVLAAVALGNQLLKFLKAMKADYDAKAQAANAALANLAGAIHLATETLSAVVGEADARLVRVEKLLADATASSEKLLTGSLKACEAIATATDKHRASVEAFSENLFGRDRGKEALEIPSEIDKDRAYTEMQFRAAGKTPEEARDLAEQELAHTGALYPSE